MKPPAVAGLLLDVASQGSTLFAFNNGQARLELHRNLPMPPTPRNAAHCSCPASSSPPTKATSAWAPFPSTHWKNSAAFPPLGKWQQRFRAHVLARPRRRPRHPCARQRRILGRRGFPHQLPARPGSAVTTRKALARSSGRSRPLITVEDWSKPEQFELLQPSMASGTLEVVYKTRGYARTPGEVTLPPVRQDGAARHGWLALRCIFVRVSAPRGSQRREQCADPHDQAAAARTIQLSAAPSASLNLPRKSCSATVAVGEPGHLDACAHRHGQLARHRRAARPRSIAGFPRHSVQTQARAEKRHAFRCHAQRGRRARARQARLLHAAAGEFHLFRSQGRQLQNPCDGQLQHHGDTGG